MKIRNVEYKVVRTEYTTKIGCQKVNNPEKLLEFLALHKYKV